MNTKHKLYNSRGKQRPERNDPYTLHTNAGLSFNGSKIYGQGFVLTPGERDELIKRNKTNGDLIQPYLGGEEINTSPTQTYHRYVINFGDMPLEEASQWPDLLAIVREKVKPERDKLRNTTDGQKLKGAWWLHGRTRPALYAAISDLPRCLVTSIVSKHLIFSFQPTNRVFSHKLYVFPFPEYTQFAILQSRVHEPWSWLLSSTMRNAGINYSASDCFDTFPFPHEDPRLVSPGLEIVGVELYLTRQAHMQCHNIGLTTLYNTLKDPKVDESRICELRELHEEMDRAVLKAYGWDDLVAKVPPFELPTPDSFKDEIIDRLHHLNLQRHTQENKSIKIA